MSILRYFSFVKSKSNQAGSSSSAIPPEVHLPDPHGQLSTKVPPEAIVSANANVKEVVMKNEVSQKKRGPYLHLTPAQRFKVGQRASEFGVTSTLRYYAKHFPELPLKEPSVRRLKNEYQSSLKGSLKGSDDGVKELPCKKTGRPLLLGDELDKQVQEYVKYMRNRGIAVNTTVVMAAAEGIIKSKDANLLNNNGGSGGIEITKWWARSLLNRMGMVKRKACSKNKITPEHFESLKGQFLLDIKQIVDLEEISHTLIINWDQTAIHYVPPSSWTMEVEGSKRVDLGGKDDKRQITACFAGTMTGDFLPTQLVYEGKTSRCLPKVDFPNDWNVTYSSTHWSNEDTMQDYIDEIILPYIMKKREELKLALDHPALLLFDNFKARYTEKILRHIDSYNIYVILIPPNCTDRLQPLDISVNKPAEDFLRREFQDWYSKKICRQFQGLESKEPVDLRLAIMKPLGAQWMISLHKYLKSNPQIIQNGFSFIRNYLKQPS